MNYCTGKGITIEELAEITGVSLAQLYLINKDPLYNVTISTVNKIWLGTQKRFEDGLACGDYLNHECFNHNK